MCDSPQTGCAKEQHPCGVNKQQQSDRSVWSLLKLAATVWSFVHMPLGLSNLNKVVLWPGCEGRARCRLHKKNVWSVWFVVKRRGCCCNLSIGVALNVWFTTNEVCMKNNTHVCGMKKQYFSDCGMWSLLLLATIVWSFAHMLLGLSNRKNPNLNSWSLESFEKSKEKVVPWNKTWKHYYHNESHQGESWTKNHQDCATWVTN